MICSICRTGERRRLVLETPEGRLTRCGRCGLVAVDPMPAPEEALALYTDGYFRDGQRGYVDYAAEEPVFVPEFRRRLRVLRASVPWGRLLEVGCATGVFLEEAARAGFDAEGIEPAEGAAASARARTGVEVKTGAIETLELPRSAYDTVVLFEVLEHLTDPVKTLGRLRESLVPGGVIALSVPDFGSLWSRASGTRWPLLTPWEHLHYFTRRTLVAAFRTAGFVRPRFAPARTVASLRTVLYRLGRRRPAASGLLARRAMELPFGTLFALAAVPPAPRRAST